MIHIMKYSIRAYYKSLFFLMMLVCVSCFGASSQHSRNSLKVAYLYNIAKFTQWPADTWKNPSDPFHFCSYGADDSKEDLQTLLHKKVGGHPIELLFPKKEDDFQLCNAFYIVTDERNRYRYLLSLINQETVLTISDDSPFFDHGGLMNLVEREKRLRFEVSTEQLENSQLKLSSKLMKLAILVDSSR